MNTPAFVAEASLYRTSGVYRSSGGRQVFYSSAQRAGPILPAVINVGDETIPIHGCPPGFFEVGEQPNVTCVLIPRGGGEDTPPGGRPDNGGPSGGGTKTPPKTPPRVPPKGSRLCTPKDPLLTAKNNYGANACLKQNDYLEDSNRYRYNLWCGPKKSDMYCCLNRGNKPIRCDKIDTQAVLIE